MAPLQVASSPTKTSFSSSSLSSSSSSSSSSPSKKTHLIIGASRGIGLELARQLLAAGHRVVATAREPTGASRLWALTGSPNGRHLSILECDVADEAGVARFAGAVARELGMGGAVKAGNGGSGGGVGGGVGDGGAIDVCVVNAGVLVYPNRIMEMTYREFSHHLTSNTIGPLLVAQALLRLSPTIPIHTLVFMSSDSGSATRFRVFEDGFAAYAASKAALNQGLRHLAAELPRYKPPLSTVVLALHPGDVATDVTNAPLGWEVEGIITPEESVSGMLKVIAEKGRGGVDERGGERTGMATFWTWDGKPHPW